MSTAIQDFKQLPVSERIQIVEDLWDTIADDSSAIAELQKKPSDYFSAGLADEDNIFEWDVCISGPPDTLL